MQKHLKLLDAPLLHARCEVKQHPRAKCAPSKSTPQQQSLSQSQHPHSLRFSVWPKDEITIVNDASTVYAFYDKQKEE